MSKSNQTSNYIFFAETKHAYVIKIIADVFKLSLSKDDFFKFTRDGIMMRAITKTGMIMFDMSFPMKNFTTYKCEKEMSVALNFDHLFYTFKQAKKKDMLQIYITKDEPEYINFSIINDKETSKANVYKMHIYSIQSELPLIDEFEYHYPKVVNSTEFQKICKGIKDISKTIKVTLQENNYISFFCDGGSLIISETSFGEFDNTKESFNANYSINIFSYLVKLSNLDTEIKFYAPKEDDAPLKIEINTGKLGSIVVYINNKD